MSKFVKFLLIASTLVATNAVMAEPAKPEAYDNLTASPQRPGQAPRLMNGIGDLSAHERKHQERLPLQLNGAIEKIKRAKYAPKREAKAAPAVTKHETKVVKKTVQAMLVTKAPKASNSLHLAPAKEAKAKRAEDFEIQAMVSPAKKGKSKTHPVGFTESLPMPNATAEAPALSGKGPQATEESDNF